MDIRPIKTEDDYAAALADIDRLMGSPVDTPDSDRLEVLVTLVEAYEELHWPIDPPDPIALIVHVMEANGWQQKDLAALIGSQPRASEILNRRRPLTLPMIRALSTQWNLPADTLVREYSLSGDLRANAAARAEP